MQDYTPGRAGYDDNRVVTQDTPDGGGRGVFAALSRLRARLIDPEAWLPQGECMQAALTTALMLFAARARPFGGPQAIAVGAFAAGMSAGLSPAALLAGCFIGCASLANPALLWPFFGCLCVLLACCVAGGRMTLAGLAISAGIANAAMMGALSGGDTYVLIMAGICGVGGAAATVLLSYALNAIKASASARGISLAGFVADDAHISGVIGRLAPGVSASGKATGAAFIILFAIMLMGLTGAAIPPSGTFPGVGFGVAASILVTLAASGISAGAGCGAGVCCWAGALLGGGDAAAYAALPAAALATALVCGRRGGGRAGGLFAAGMRLSGRLAPDTRPSGRTSVQSGLFRGVAPGIGAREAYACSSGETPMQDGPFRGLEPGARLSEGTPTQDIPFCGLMPGIGARETETYSSGARTARALVFMLACGVCAALQPDMAADVPYLEMAIAGAAYAFIPAGWLAALPGLALAPACASPELMQQRRLTRQSEEQLARFAAAAVQLADSLEPQSVPEPFDMAAHARATLCAGCDRYAACWQAEPSPAEYAFSELYGQLIERRAIDGFVLPLDCARGDGIVLKLVPYAINAIAEQFRRQELDRVSGTYSQRLRGMAGALSDGARSLRFRREPDAVMSLRVYEALYRAGIPCAGVCVESGAPRLTQIAFQYAPEQAGRMEVLHEKAIGIAQRTLGYGLEPAGECENGLLLREAPPIALTYGAARRSSVGRTDCGDSFSISETQRGLVLIALADGMGRGKSAARASANAVSMLENLLCAGLDCDGALRSVNDLLLSDPSRDAYSTLDLSVIDRYGCVLEICKLGAPATYLLRGDACSPIAGVSPPAGIVESARASHKTVCLQPGDVIVQLTDGVCDTTIPGLQRRMTVELGEFMRRQTAYARENPLQPFDAQRLASELLAFSSERFGSRDDATVLVTRISVR